MTKKNKIYYLEVLRMIACLAVIMIHASCVYVINYKGFTNFFVGSVFDGFARVGVPIFVMISGALLLDENYDYSKEKLIKHIKKMVIFFVFWSFVYCLMFNILGQILLHSKITISFILNGFIQGYYHLWYIYLIIGFYLLLPLLRLWVKDENKKYVEYFMLLSIIFVFIIPQIISICNQYTTVLIGLSDILNNKLHLEYIGGFTTYFLLGWYINKYEIKRYKEIYLLGIICLIFSILGTCIITVSISESFQLYNDISIQTLLYCSAVFLFIKNTFSTKKENKLVCMIAKNSLGIYAIHAMFITIMYKFIDSRNFGNALINIPLVFAVAFICSFIGSYILSKIPLFKKVV